MFKKLFFLIFLILITSLIVSSFLPIETAYKYFYQTLWFKILGIIIGLGLCHSVINFLKKKLVAPAVICLGILMVIIGGMLSSSFGEEGYIEIKEHQSVDGFWVEDDLFRPLDFSLTLRDFSVKLYPGQRKGMRFVKSYRSSVSISKNGQLVKEGVIEVNKPLSFSGFSFYQYGYDIDLPDQTILQVVKDPGVIPAYVGYFLLLAGMILSFKKAWKCT